MRPAWAGLPVCLVAGLLAFPSASNAGSGVTKHCAGSACSAAGERDHALRRLTHVFFRETDHHGALTAPAAARSGA